MAELMNRRDWLKTATGLVVGFTFSGLPAFGEQAAPGPLASDGRTLDPKEVDSALSINPDGSVTIYTSKVDVGTGMRIAMAQMAAEELGVDTARITVVDGDTARCPNTGGTGGSTGLTRGGTAVRQAAATARQALLGLARGAAEASRRGPDDRGRARFGRRLAVAVSAIGGARSAVGALPCRSTPRRRSWLSVALHARRPVSGAGPMCPRSAPGATNTSRTSPFRACCHGRVVRPPAIGATLVSVDEASIARIPGVRVVRIESFLAVVAEDEWAAVRASRELERRGPSGAGFPVTTTSSATFATASSSATRRS